MVTRREFFLSTTALAVGASGCLGDGTAGGTEPSGGDDGGGGTGGDGAGPPTRELASPLHVPPEEFENASTDVLRKDGIPSIDEPEFDDGGNVDDGDPVFGVVMDGEARAYPQDILAQHEIVNDTVAGKNVAVTYCPLTGTVIGYERGGTTFGVSGDLVNSNLIMYDRTTETRYPQILGVGTEGANRGRSLVEFDVTWTTWERWRDEYPDSPVLSRDVAVRNYDRDPYGGYNPISGYYDNDRLIFDVMNRDDRYHPKKVFMAARDADEAVAFDKERLRDEGELSIETENGKYVAVYEEPLDTARVERDGELLPAFDAMWFAWAAFYPDTHVE
ncbi:MAG: DUF3179 domain-containing protein [Halobacteriales archaeon]|nr:DUF3179 domain-containing protein [Halobacteriales archaeon]